MATIYYICDRKACGEKHDCGECRHTSQIEHAVNFAQRHNKNTGKFFEKISGEEKESDCLHEAQVTKRMMFGFKFSIISLMCSITGFIAAIIALL